MIIDFPLVKQHQVPTIQTDRKTVEVHQSQQTDRVVVVLIVTQQQVSMFQKVQKTTEFPHVALIVRFLDVRVVRRTSSHQSNSADVKVAQAHYIEGWCSCQVGRCVRTVGCATDSVLQQRVCQSSCVLQRKSPWTLRFHLTGRARRHR